MSTRPVFGNIFPKPNNLLVVVHVMDVTQTLKSIDALVDGGADGCFLIQHDGDQALLRRAYRKARRAHPKIWIGLNFLKKTPVEAALLAGEPHLGTATRMKGGGPIPPPDGLWVDDPLAVEHFWWELASCRGSFPEGFLDIHASDVSPHAHASGNLLPESLYFPGAGFKYQRDKGVSLAQECRIVATRGDVVTTSGDRTGQPPNLEKILEIRAAIGPEIPLAIASGIDPKNVGQFRPYVQAFLVASSITGAWEMTDADKVRELAEAVNG